MGRSIGAVVAGIIVVGIVVGGLQFVLALIYPLPADLDPFDPGSAEALAAHIEGMPITAWMLVFASEIVGVFLGALTAGSIAASGKAKFVGGIVLLGLAGSVMNWTSFSHPMWFIIGQLIAYPAVFFAVAGFLGKPRDEAP